MAVNIQIRNDTAANWSSANPILMVGEMGVDTTNDQFRIGDGTNNWNDLPVAGMTSGATLEGDLDFDLFSILNYTEGTPATQTHSASGALTLNCANGNIHVVNVQAAITSVAITNAPANKTTSLTLRLLADDDHAITWLAGTAVISASTGVSAANADNSFNSSEAFADNLQAGDLITVSGFTDAETELNAIHRVISATTSKIVVDTAITVDEAAGQAVTITRHNLYPEAPDAPTAHTPKDFVLYTYDGVRWNISEVGEF